MLTGIVVFTGISIYDVLSRAKDILPERAPKEKAKSKDKDDVPSTKDLSKLKIVDHNNNEEETCIVYSCCINDYRSLCVWKYNDDRNSSS